MRLSLPVPAVRAVVRGGVQPVLRPTVPLAVQRAWVRAVFVGARGPAGVTRTATTLGGRPAERHLPAGADASRAVLLLHGGAFMTCSPATHRAFAGHLAQAAGCAVHVLDHRLSPEHPFPAPLDDALAAYDELAAGARTAVVGDSAGGTLAMLLARTRTPSALALVSPLVDLTLASSTSWTGEDPLLNHSWAQQGVAAFLGGADAAGLSPLQDDLTGRPPLLVHVSEHEMLRPEGEQLVERARAAGVDAEVVLLPGLWHDVHLQAHLLDEAAQACALMGRWLAARG